MSEWLKRLKNSSSSSAKSTTDSDSTSKSDDMLLNAHLDRKAVLDSFKNHWLQAWNIMLTKRIPMRFDTTNGGDANVITNDDVTTIINHIEQMTTLLLEENKHVSTCIASPIAMSPLMDYLLMESVLDKIFNWSLNAGEYTNVMKMEQLKLYELLITELCHQTALFQKPLIRPLLQLLATCGDCAPVEVEKRLVILLNTLCVSIEKNTHLLELFFAPYNDKEDVNVPSVSEITSSPQIISKFSYLHKPESRFLIVSLLIPFVHREGPIGQQARDSLLVILSLSRTQEAIGAYIAEHSNFCPVLATGLSGLYSSLPRKLPYDAIQMGDWHQITTEDINESPELRNFLHSLEFCNAVVQVSHAVVTNQLLEYIYQGFLVSVVGPALHQDALDVPLDVLETSRKYTNSLEEMIATTAYLELFLRTINEPSLLQVFLRFVCVEKFDEQRILHTLIGRINANTKLGLVTIVFFRTLLDLNCEDVLLELVLKYLITCDFVGDERCESLSDVKDFDKCAQKFLSLIPSCCFATMQTYSPIKCSNNEDQHIEDDAYGLSPISPTLSHTLHPLNNYIEYLNDGHYAIKCCQTACKMWSTSYTVAKDENAQSPVSSSKMDNSPMDSGIYLNTSGANNEVNATQVPETQSTISQSTNWGESCLIGPFLSNVFDRLSNMQSNDVYTNLQLTGLLSRLATYSQPILRSFLLNPHLTASCKCRNLWSVLSTVQQQLEKSAAEIDNFVDLWIKTKDFFKSREELLMKSDSRKHSNTSSEVFITIETPKEPKRRSISQLLFRSRAQSTPVNPHTLKSIGNGAGYKYINKRHSRVDEAIEAEQLAKSLQQQRTALSIVVLEEFLKELSALAQEHFILGYTSECRVN